METAFMKSKNSLSFHPHRLLLNLTDKIDLPTDEKSFALSNLNVYLKSTKFI